MINNIERVHDVRVHLNLPVLSPLVSPLNL